ncbi:ParB N-terminal domain-containing protein [Streptococcus pyogenes]|uniref:ParB N-terminal domain-containing protein n=1 Tax=Streptococcus pyogenes TaxID=1314 RepID=UPI000B8D694B|nr:ParB N-terminal domain-containing protein [Streptococcus pyogenes]ASQ21754.1 hypothetical protein B4W66_07690 [Streptococcus pyogenes]
MGFVDKKLSEITPYKNNPRNNDEAVGPVAESIKEFGFKVPIVVDKNGEIINGHTRYKAAQKLGLETVPVIVADDLSEEQIKAFRLADNKVGEIAVWDLDLLNEELNDILDLDMSAFGFELEIDDENQENLDADFEEIEDDFVYPDKPVIDCIPCHNVEELQKMFYAVGFGSVPSWLKPYHVLSNGEKMRVDLARRILTKEFIVFDEFTSVVDRQVAKIICIALKKALKRYPDKKFIAVGCHHDVIEFLQPDWCFNTDDMQQVFRFPHEANKNSQLEDAQLPSGENLDVIII